jgi:hypothetical protein
MLGSPNYVRFVYDGDGSATPEPGDEGPNGSAQIEAIFNNYFGSQSLATAPTAFDGRSDYGPFIAAGIPAGGLFSGAEGVTTAEEAAVSAEPPRTAAGCRRASRRCRWISSPTAGARQQPDLRERVPCALTAGSQQTEIGPAGHHHSPGRAPPQPRPGTTTAPAGLIRVGGQ